MEMWLSDLIVIWRAWALFQLDQHWVILIPFILWIGIVGEYLAISRESVPLS